MIQAPRAIYPGTFDPITKGHIDLVERMLPLFSEVTVVVARNPWKETLFSVEERVDFIRDIFKQRKKVKVDCFDGLVVDYAEKNGATVIIRGLRAVSDFEFELQMALTNRSLNSRIETVFFMPDARYIYHNSTMAKEIAQFSGNTSNFVTSGVARALKRKKMEKGKRDKHRV